MKRAYIRSILYNIGFYGLTATACVLCLPALLLPRKHAMWVVDLFIYTNYFLEKYVLGLRYEVRGVEHLPAHGSYIVAAKHQSAYETMKLHILFKDPAIILKKELLSIPIWGWYLKKSDVIAIDRSSREAATKSIQEGAIHMKEEGRPIVIFPQGTRVKVDATPKEKPYKIGVARIQEATGLPIIPLAMNSGMYWPRNSFFKSKGTVVFEFLKPIEPGIERGKLIAKLEKEVEGASNALMEEARKKQTDEETQRRTPLLGLVGFVLLVLAGFWTYSAYWHLVAKHVYAAYIEQVTALKGEDGPENLPAVSGYPGKMTLQVPYEIINSPDGRMAVYNLSVSGWPFPHFPLLVQSGKLSIESEAWDGALNFDSMQARLRVDGNLVTFEESDLIAGDFTGHIIGSLDFNQKPFPKMDVLVTLENHQTLLNDLAVVKIIDARTALFLGSGFEALRDPDTGFVSLPIHQKGEMLMAGPLPVMRLPIYSDVSIKRTRPTIPTQRAPSQPSPESSGPDLDSLQDPVP